jgi:hypothetical protein
MIATSAVVVSALSGATEPSAFAQSTATNNQVESANPQALAKKVANPLTDIVSVPVQFNWINGVGPDNELRMLTYVQPVVPMSISKDWNLIGRWVVPYLAQPEAFGGSSGISDMIAQAFFSPKTSGTFMWGVGPMLYLPTTRDPTLGYGKWSAGPVAAVIRQQGSMTYGMLWNNIWSFAGTGDTPRPDVNMGYFQPVIAHSSRSGVTITLSTETIADWNAADSGDRWTVPITVAVSKITRFGMLPMSVQLGTGYYVVKPTYGPSWQLRTTFTLLLPRSR